MRRLAAAFALFCLTAPLPVAAQNVDYCTEAWVIRNLIFDRLGHCFGSVAGQALFDNSNCTVTGPTPPPALADAVRLIREGEAFVGCQVNADVPPSQGMWQTLSRFSGFSDIPVPDHVGGYGCFGYRGPAFELRAGTSLAAPAVGIAQPGHSIVSTYFGSLNGWVFAEVLTSPDGALVTEGWFTGVDLSPNNCAQVAG